MYAIRSYYGLTDGDSSAAAGGILLSGLRRLSRLLGRLRRGGLGVLGGLFEPVGEVFEQGAAGAESVALSGRGEAAGGLV